ncbi:MAG: heme-binding protein [bacterium]
MLNLEVAQNVVKVALAHGRTASMRPLTVVVLDARASVVAAASEDGSSLKRFEIARGKASGALAFNVGSRGLGVMAVERPHFFAGAAHVAGGLVPVAGGVLIRSETGAVLGAVGISGDNSDNDEAAAVAGIVAAGLKADGG